jgi:hypothetical protein
MNIPLAVPCDQFDRLRACRDADADAAQRDLFEYFAPPLTEGNAPPIAADAPPAVPPEAVAEEDEDAAWHDQILAWYDATQDDEISDHEPESPDEIAACDADAGTARAEVAPLDEVSKVNLRRLETTLNWLQTEAEACRLPPVTPLPLVPGLPAVEPGIDRGTLDRTRHQAPPLPAWLREPEKLLPAPPHRGRVLWPRAPSRS